MFAPRKARGLLNGCFGQVLIGGTSFVVGRWALTCTCGLRSRRTMTATTPFAQPWPSLPRAHPRPGMATRRFGRGGAEIRPHLQHRG